MAKSNSRPFDNDGDFAAAVVKLYTHVIGAEGEYRLFAGDQSLDVRRVAFGMAFIRQLLDAYAKLPHVPWDIPLSGVAEAYGILAHLTTGDDHPIARHIAGIKSERFRPQRAPANEVELVKRAAVVGLVRALQSVSEIPPSEAIRLTIRAAKNAGIIFTENQLRGWDRRGGTLPDFFANMLLSGGAPDPDKILRLGANYILTWWGVASLSQA